MKCTLTCTCHVSSLYIVSCQRGGVSNKPPGLRAATQIASPSKSRLGFPWATVGPWDLHGLGLSHSNPTWAPPGPAHCWPMAYPDMWLNLANAISPHVGEVKRTMPHVNPTQIPRWDFSGLRGLAHVDPTWAPQGLAIWAGILWSIKRKSMDRTLDPF